MATSPRQYPCDCRFEIVFLGVPNSFAQHPKDIRTNFRLEKKIRKIRKHGVETKNLVKIVIQRDQKISSLYVEVKMHDLPRRPSNSYTNLFSNWYYLNQSAASRSKFEQ